MLSTSRIFEEANVIYKPLLLMLQAMDYRLIHKRLLLMLQTMDSGLIHKPLLLMLQNSYTLSILSVRTEKTKNGILFVNQV